MLHATWRLLVGKRVRATYDDSTFEGTLDIPKWPIRADDGTSS